MHDSIAREQSLLVSDDEMENANRYNHRADELFDDFLYVYIHDKDVQLQRTLFPIKELLIDGSTHTIDKDMWHDALDFMNNEYTTTIYGDIQDKGINENTSLENASVERIDLLKTVLTSYDFIKDNGKWNLKEIRNMSFNDCDLRDFLFFYSKFSQDSAYQRRSLAKSIRISMLDPEDDTQIIEGFINREQWSTINNGIPGGIISNIRYGQKYDNAKSILMEKVSIGNGMSETFYFAKNRNKWELVGYEN